VGCGTTLTNGKQRITHLKTAFAEKLIGRAERYLNYSSKFCHLFRGVILNVGNTLKRSELMDEKGERLTNSDKREDTSK
jgi:hypothetical protein